MDRNNLILKDLPSEIYTERLLLRTPRAGDGVKLLTAMKDGYSEFVKWLNWPTEMPLLEEVELQCRHQQAQWVLREDLRFLCIRKDNNEIIGRLAFPNSQCVWETPLIGISYFISKSHQNHGYGTEAVRALVKYAFDNLDAKKVEIKCDSENVASFKIPEKLGFSHESTQKGIWPRPGAPLAEVRTYALFKKSHLI